MLLLPSPFYAWRLGSPEPSPLRLRRAVPGRLRAGSPGLPCPLVLLRCHVSQGWAFSSAVAADVLLGLEPSLLVVSRGTEGLLEPRSVLVVPDSLSRTVAVEASYAPDGGHFRPPVDGGPCVVCGGAEDGEEGPCPGP